MLRACPSSFLSLLKSFIYLYMDGYFVYMFVCAPMCAWCPRRPEDVRPPETGITSGLKLNLGLLEEKSVLLTAESSF